jgi:hypothetical protein
MKTSQKSILILILMMLPFSIKIHASGKGDKDYKAFSNAMGKLLDATDDGFEKITGPIIDSVGGMKRWSSKTGLPGAEQSMIIDEMVISKYYMGIFKGTLKKEEIQAQYNKYAQYLDQFMTSKNYHIQKAPNETSAPDFEDIIYRMAEDSPLPIEKQPFIKMNVTYNNETNEYSLTIYVNQNFL